MVSMSAFINLPLHHKVQKFSSGTGSPGWSRKKGCKTVVVVVRRDAARVMNIDIGRRAVPLLIYYDRFLFCASCCTTFVFYNPSYREFIVRPS